MSLKEWEKNGWLKLYRTSREEIPILIRMRNMYI